MYQSSQCGWHLPNISLRTQGDQRVSKRRDRTKVLGPEKLYIPRSKVSSKRARFLFGEHIEECLKAEGFETFSPKTHMLKS